MESNKHTVESQVNKWAAALAFIPNKIRGGILTSQCDLDFVLMMVFGIETFESQNKM